VRPSASTLTFGAKNGEELAENYWFTDFCFALETVQQFWFSVHFRFQVTSSHGTDRRTDGQIDQTTRNAAACKDGLTVTKTMQIKT